jgi:hypothetical protein
MIFFDSTTRLWGSTVVKGSGVPSHDHHLDRHLERHLD